MKYTKTGKENGQKNMFKLHSICIWALLGYLTIWFQNQNESTTFLGPALRAVPRQCGCFEEFAGVPLAIQILSLKSPSD